MSSRLDAVTATPWKPLVVATLALRTLPNELSLPAMLWLLPSPLRSMGPRLGVPTWPALRRPLRSPLEASALLRVDGSLVSMPEPPGLFGSRLGVDGV